MKARKTDPELFLNISKMRVMCLEKQHHMCFVVVTETISSGSCPGINYTKVSFIDSVQEVIDSLVKRSREKGLFIIYNMNHTIPKTELFMCYFFPYSFALLYHISYIITFSSPLFNIRGLASDTTFVL